VTQITTHLTTSIAPLSPVPQRFLSDVETQVEPASGTTKTDADVAIRNKLQPPRLEAWAQSGRGKGASGAAAPGAAVQGTEKYFNGKKNLRSTNLQ
jgi:hypothetical protein